MKTQKTPPKTAKATKGTPAKAAQRAPIAPHSDQSSAQPIDTGAETTVKPPRHLRAATGRWWGAVMVGFDLEAHHLRLLTLACEAWDRCTQAREALAKHGLTFQDRFGSPKARPEVGIERDSRIAFARILREIGLDIAPPDDPRPPRVGGKG